MAKFRPRARIIRTIGDQLVSGPAAAIIELVKNAYDADSDTVEIKIVPSAKVSETVRRSEKKRGETKTPGLIAVKDNGHGMSFDDMVNKWFEPATSEKVHRKKSPGNRLLLGAKGVGRFATARLGDKLKLTSIVVAKGAVSSTIELDWRSFANYQYLDEIDLPIVSEEVPPNSCSGVALSISDLRDEWTKKQLEELIRELRRLISPLDKSKKAFRIFLDLSAFNMADHGFDGQALVAGTFNQISIEGEAQGDPREIKPISFENLHHYRLKGLFSKDGSFKGTFRNFRGDAKVVPIELPPKPSSDEEVICGRVKIQLNIFDRESEAIVELLEKAGMSGVGKLDAKRILDENIGIGIYRNNFRIRPYGDAQTDWLELERKRVQNPSQKLGLNQVWGMVLIEDEESSHLIERSSREGLEHNGAFFRLKSLVEDVLVQAEALRVDTRQKAGRSRKPTANPDQIRGAANLTATRKAASEYVPEKFREKFDKAIERDALELMTAIQDLNTYHESLVSISNLGLVVAHTVHEGRRFLSDIATRSSRLVKGAPRLDEDSTFGRHFRSEFPKDAKSIHESAGGLVGLFKALDPISGRRRGRPQSFMPSLVIKRCVELLSLTLDTAKVTVKCDPFVNEPLVLGYESDLMTAVLNVLDNAIHWLSTSSRTVRTVTVTLKQSKEFVSICIANDGPPINEKFRDRIFDPGFSLKTGGSGLGLAIAREAIRASKGDIAFAGDDDETKFVIEMRKVSQS